VAAARPEPEDDVTVGPSRTGLGVFVRRAYRAGEPILEFRGAVVDFPFTLGQGDREGDALQIGPGVYLDLEGTGRLVNHSCIPNAGVRDRVVLVAARDLEPGEEVLYDYSTTMDEDHWTLECRCGQPACRGLVRDFKWLTPDRKVDLIRRDLVPPFIVAREIESGRLAVGALASPVTGVEAGGDPSPLS